MHIKDGVNAMLSTEINDTIQVLEAGSLENTGVHVICGPAQRDDSRQQGLIQTFKVTIVERNTNAVQPQTFEELGIFLLEEVLQKLEDNKFESSVFGCASLAVIDTLSKNSSDFSDPMTSARASRIWNSHPGYPEMKFSILRSRSVPFQSDCSRSTYFIHPPKPAPLKTTSSPFSLIILVPEIFRRDMIVVDRTPLHTKRGSYILVRIRDEGIWGKRPTICRMSL